MTAPRYLSNWIPLDREPVILDPLTTHCPIFIYKTRGGRSPVGGCATETAPIAKRPDEGTSNLFSQQYTGISTCFQQQVKKGISSFFSCPEKSFVSLYLQAFLTRCRKLGSLFSQALAACQPGTRRTANV